MGELIHVAFGRGGGRVDPAEQAQKLYAMACDLDEHPDGRAQAEELYRRALDLDPRLAVAATNLGRLLHQRGATRKAEEMFRHALDLDPNQPEALYNLGFVLLEQGRTFEAIANLEGAVTSAPDFADAHYQLARAFEQARAPASARKHYERYLALASGRAEEQPIVEAVRQHLDAL